MQKIQHFLSAHATNLWMMGVFAIAAYLSLVNLGQGPLWHDEATPAYMGENFARNFTLSGWNGRTLYVGENGTAINSELTLASFPPWPTYPSALGIAIFGANEFGVRIFHTLLGLASLLLFWQLLRMDFAIRPRLRVLAFTLFALSAQVILFMRVGRYVADAFFFTFLSFYAYRLYIAPGGKVWHLALAAAATVLGFLNHFTMAAAFALALGVWHLLYHFRHTTRRQWVEIGIAAAVTSGLCFAYLVGMGIVFSDDVLEFSSHETPFLQRKVTLVWWFFRDLLRSGMLPLWVAVWLAWFAFARRSGKGNAARAGDDTARHLLRWTALLALFLVFSGLLSVREPTYGSAVAEVREPTYGGAIAEIRYIAPALAFGALLTAAFIDWLWERRRAGRVAAIAALLLALNSNLLTYPLTFPDHDANPHHPLLSKLLREVHTASRDGYMREALAYLRKHAQEGDTIFVHPYLDSLVLQFYLSGKLVFCCALNEGSHLPREKVRALGVPIYEGDVEPDWFVVVDEGKEIAVSDYALAHTSQTHALPTQRPDHHTFTPLYTPPYQRIYRRVR